MHSTLLERLDSVSTLQVLNYILDSYYSIVSLVHKHELTTKSVRWTWQNIQCTGYISIL